jgi:predicted metal-dependent hydrolase
MTTALESVHLDTMTIPIRRSGRRKSVGITVDRDGSVYVAAPKKCDLEKIEAYVRSKSLWIYTKLHERDQLVGDEPHTKQFVDGASFLYLGHSHRLRLIDRSEDDLSPPLVLSDDWFLLDRAELNNASVLFRRWYASQGLPLVNDTVTELSDRIATPSAFEIRDIGFRWGSCTAEGKVLINWRAIQLPFQIMKYVVAHELVHLLHRNHDAKFWTHLQRVMPDYEERKTWLAHNGEPFAAEF